MKITRQIFGGKFFDYFKRRVSKLVSQARDRRRLNRLHSPTTPGPSRESHNSLPLWFYVDGGGSSDGGSDGGD